MDEYLNCRYVIRKRKKRFKNRKPYWNERLTKLWRDMHNKENIFLKCKNEKRERNNRYRAFKDAQYICDKTLTKKERQYNLLLEIEEVNVNNPAEMWNYIKKPWSKTEKGNST